MASEIQADYTTGRTLYAQVRNTIGQIWNTAGVAFEAYNTANIADYDIAMTEQGTASGYYAGNMPAAASGTYNVVVKDRAGGSPAESDKTVAAGLIGWNGSAVILPVNVTQFGGSAGTFSGGRPEVNTTHLAGTSQTARDIGASVLLSNGTGAGQLKLASGYVAMTWADIGSPATVVNLSGTTIKTATDVETDTADIQSRLPAALVGGRMDSNVQATAAALTFNLTGNITGNLSGSVGSVTATVSADMVSISGDATAADNLESAYDGTGYTGAGGIVRAGTAQAGGSVDTIKLDAGASATDDVYNGCVIRLMSGTGAGQIRVITDYNGTTKIATIDRAWSTPDATTTFEIRVAQESSLTAAITGVVGSVGTGAITSNSFQNDAITAAALAADAGTEIFNAVVTSQLTEAYAADGVAPTLAQAIFLIQQSLHEFAISGTTRTVKKLDGSTTAATFTLDSATAPTSTTRAT